MSFRGPHCFSARVPDRSWPKGTRFFFTTLWRRNSGFLIPTARRGSSLRSQSIPSRHVETVNSASRPPRFPAPNGRQILSKEAGS